ncbi:hypothetical protein PFISCL1PPCAC_9174, partial [Pristionchus fissidentatus]
VFSLMDSLEFGEGTPFEKGLWPRQASDGTIFYVKVYDNSSISVLNNGKKVTAIKSWDGEIDYFKCFDYALYIRTDANKIYTATFHPPNEIRITFIRDLEEFQGESHNCNMLLSRKINGRKVIYRACDDPKNGIIVDVEEEKLCTPVAIHRGKLIYINPNLKDKIAINLSPNIIVVKCSSVINIANDDSPLVYCCQYEMNSCSLIVLDTTTMETLTIKWPESVNNSTTNYSYLIVGVHGGEITVRRLTTTKVGDKWEETHEICKAKFP